MSSKMVQLQEILNKDNLVKQLIQLFDKWSLQRLEKEEEWRELRNYIFATDTTTTTNSSLPWKNTTTIPKLTQIRDNLHANYMDALFPNDDWLRWEGYSQQDVVKEKRSAIESYMKNKTRESGFRETISKCLYDYIDYGNAIADVVWENNYHVDPLTGERVTTYVGPKICRTSPFDITFNPIASSFKDTPKFTRYIKSTGELKKDIETRLDLQYNSEVFAKFRDTRGKLMAFRREDIAKFDSLRIDGFGSYYEYLQSGYVEILEFEGTIYDEDRDILYENQIITIIDRLYILRNIPNASWFGKDAKEHVGWRNRPDNLYGMGPLDNLVGMQYRLDHLENLKADAMDLAVQPPIAIVGDVDPFTWQPFEQVHIPEDGSVTPLFSNSNVFQVNNEIGALIALMEEMAGAPKEAMGIRSPGEKTAFEVQQLQNAAGRIFQHKINKFEIEFLEPLLNNMLEVARRNMDSSDLVRVMDDDLGVATFMSITKEDITARGKLRPIGSRHYATRAQLLQNLVGIFNSPMGQMIAPHVSSKKLASLIEDYMGFEQFDFMKDNAMIFEQAETQRLINQVQQTLQVEQQTPVEETMLGGGVG